MITAAPRRALVTGGASGLGMQAALQLSRRGCHVIVADRNAFGGQAVARSIAADGGRAEFRQIDLGDLDNVRAFAAETVARGEPIDILLNNAGLLPPMARTTTKDGFELAFGVAYLGHFALTGLLLPALLRSASPRVVSVSSNSHPGGRIDFGNLQLERGYSPWRAYANSKLACLMFAIELQRRADAGNVPLLSVAAHPGVSRTAIAAGWQNENRRRLRDRLELAGYHAFMRFFDRDATEGARSLVLAALAPGLQPGGYYGPTGFLQGRGEPGSVKSSRKAHDRRITARLWEVSEQLTGVRWNMPAAKAA